jgi:hypothetical protein
MEEAMATLLRGEHQRKARIARDVDAVERVHLDGDGEAHASSFCSIERM